MAGRQRDLVFISYSHVDQEWLKKLRVFLKAYERKGLKVWCDPYIEVGQRWEREIERALEDTCVGVLLISQDFIASDFIYENELPPLREGADKDELTLVCVPISDATFEELELDEYQWVLDPKKPLWAHKGNHRHTALVKIAKAIVEASKGCGGETAVQTLSKPKRQASALSAARQPGILIGVPNQKPHHVPRTGDMQRIKNALFNLNRQSVGIVGSRPQTNVRVGLQGMGGIGKTELAVYTVNDPEVRHAFPDGVYWTSLGQEPAVESLQSSLLNQITGERVTVESRSEGAMLLREALRGRQALLVVDDVWSNRDALAFDVANEQSRMLVTTRDATVLTALGAEELTLEVLSEKAALQLLALWSGEALDTLPLEAEAEAVAKECGYLPLALAVAGAQVHDGRSWVDLAQTLKEGRLDYLDHPYGSIFTSLRLSVDALDEEIRHRYLELAVFPEDIPIPHATIERYWHHTGNLTSEQSHTLLGQLERKGLLYLNGDKGDPKISFHDLQRDYLQLVAEDLTGLHTQLLSAHVAAYGTGKQTWHWSDLPVDEPYLWLQLAYHLKHADSLDELEGLLLDFRWLYAKLKAAGLNALMADFALAPKEKLLKLMRQTLELSAHVVEANPEQLASQVLGRLPETEKKLRCALLSGIKSVLSNRIWLRPLHPSLIRPGGALIKIFEGHEAAVAAVAISPNGKNVISASFDCTLRLWDIETAESIGIFQGHDDWVTAVAITPNGRCAISASFDDTLRLWEIETSKTMAIYEGHKALVTSVAITPDGKHAISASFDHTLRLWDIETTETIAIFKGHKSLVMDVAIMPGGQRAVSASSDHTLRLWDIKSAQTLSIFKGHEGAVSAVEILPDSRRFVSASDDCTIRLWDIEKTEALNIFKGHKHPITDVEITPDGSRIISSSDDLTLRLWDIETTKLLASYEGHEAWINSVAITSDGRSAISASNDRTLRLWNIDLMSNTISFDGHEAWIRDVAMMPDNQRVLSASDDHTLRLWDIERAEAVSIYEGHESYVNAVAATPDGFYAISASNDCTLRLWDLATSETITIFEGHEAPVYDVALTPDGRYALSASAYRTLRLWDIGTAETIATYEGHEASVMAVAILPDGRRAISASDDYTLRLWDILTTKQLAIFTGHEASIMGVAITPDGKFAISASKDHTLRIWNIETAKTTAILRGHQARVNSVVITPDGQHAISASNDHTLRIWDIKTRRQLVSYSADGAQLAAAISTDGRQIVAGGRLGRLHILAIEPPEHETSGIPPK